MLRKAQHPGKLSIAGFGKLTFETEKTLGVAHSFQISFEFVADFRQFRCIPHPQVFPCIGASDFFIRSDRSRITALAAASDRSGLW